MLICIYLVTSNTNKIVQIEICLLDFRMNQIMKSQLNHSPTSLKFNFFLLKKNLWAPVIFLIYFGTAKLLYPLSFDIEQIKIGTINSSILVWIPTLLFVIFSAADVRRRLHEILDGFAKLKNFLISLSNYKEKNKKISREISLLSCLAMTQFCSCFSAPIYKKNLKLKDDECDLTPTWIKKNGFENLCLEDLLQNIDEKLEKLTFTSGLDHWNIFKELCQNLSEHCWKRTFFSWNAKMMIVLTGMINLLQLQNLSFGNQTAEKANGFLIFSVAIIFLLLLLVVHYEILVDLKSLNLVDFVESGWKQFVKKLSNLKMTTSLTDHRKLTVEKKKKKFQNQTAIWNVVLDLGKSPKSKPCSPEQEPLDNNLELILDNYFEPQTLYNKETTATRFVPIFTMLIADLCMLANKKKEEFQKLTSKTACVVAYLVNNLRSILSDNLEPQFLDNMEKFFRIVKRSTLPNSLSMIPEKDFAALFSWPLCENHTKNKAANYCQKATMV